MAAQDQRFVLPHKRTRGRARARRTGPAGSATGRAAPRMRAVLSLSVWATPARARGERAHVCTCAVILIHREEGGWWGKPQNQFVVPLWFFFSLSLSLSPPPHQTEGWRISNRFFPPCAFHPWISQLNQDFFAHCPGTKSPARPDRLAGQRRRPQVGGETRGRRRRRRSGVHGNWDNKGTAAAAAADMGPMRRIPPRSCTQG